MTLRSGHFGRRFHWSWRWMDFTDGPLGLGFRLFFWKPSPHDWACNVDLLTPLFDFQIGFHEIRPAMEDADAP